MLTVATQTTAPVLCAKANTDLYIHTQPNPSAPIITAIPQGSQIVLQQGGSSWWYISAGRLSGWARGKYLIPEKCK